MDIKILTTLGCAACAKVKSKLDKLKVKYEVIDVTKKPELLNKYPIMAAPGIVINGKLEFTGNVSEKELREKLNLYKHLQKDFKYLHWVRINISNKN